MSLASMTGFARHDDGDGQFRWHWEVRSVNGRNLEVRCRLPAGMDGLEPLARKAAAARFRRGNLSLALFAKRSQDDLAIKLNEPLLAQLGDLIEPLQERLGAAPPRLDGLLNLRGVIDVEEPEESEEARAEREAALLSSLDTALIRLQEARAIEGGQLAVVLGQQIDELAALADRAKATAELQPKALQRRLLASVAEIVDSGAEVPEERIAQEIAILVTKADVTEELDRLVAHIATARQLVADGGPDGATGRRLDFLAQELNREANTLCSKAQDPDLTNIGMEIKVIIDRFREQAQNVE